MNLIITDQAVMILKDLYDNQFHSGKIEEEMSNGEEMSNVEGNNKTVHFFKLQVYIKKIYFIQTN